MEHLNKDWLSGVLSKYENQPRDDHRWGKVEAVNADGSYMVRIGDGEPARCSNGCAANVGDVVFTVVTKDGLCVAMCRLGGDLGGGGSATEQATFYDSSTAIVTETAQGWAVVKLNECRAKTDGFDEVATFEDGVLTFLQSGCYEVTANAFWHGMTGQCGIGLWNGDTEEWSAFTSGPTIDSVSIPPVTLKVSAGETRTLKQYVHSGAQTRHSCYAWLTVSYFGSGGTPSGGGGGGGIMEETDPTVPDWAKQPNPPTYTAEDVGAEPSGAVTAHNVATDAHNDIRLLIDGLSNRLNAVADSEDIDLDQLSELVAYIKANRELIESVTTSKVNVSDIIDNLTTNVGNKPLSAAQGVALKALIDAITVPTKVSAFENDAGYLTSAALSDKLLESGVTNGWTWRKWESGVYECWGIFNDTCTHYTVVTPFYGFYSSSFPYPITFPSPPIVLFNCKIGNGFGMPAGDVMRSSSACRCYALSTAKDTVSCVWEIKVIGRWK